MESTLTTWNTLCPTPIEKLCRWIIWDRAICTVYNSFRRAFNYSITRLPNLPMSKFAEPMSRLIDELKKLPGVGAKSAQRLAFHILRSSEDDAEALAAAVIDVKAKLRLCSVCNNITDVDPCAYCTSATRNQRMVCVVEEPTN